MQDSAGVSVVVAPRSSSFPVRTVDTDAAALVLGGGQENPDAELSSGSYWITAVRLSDGRSVVADGTRLMWYDRHGNWNRSVGREGEGPNEFASIQGLCRFQGDSLIVWDERNVRVSVLDGDGNPARAFTPDGWVVLNECTEDGWLLAQEVSDGSPGRDSAAFVLMTSTGQVVNRVGRLPVSVYRSPPREVWYALTGGRIVVGDAVSMGVSVLSQEGHLERRIRTSDEPRFLRGKAAEREQTGEAAEGTVAAPAASTGGYAAMYYRMAIDREERIWLLTQRSRAGDARWVVMEQDGSPVGMVQLDTSSVQRIVNFAENAVVLLVQDPDAGDRLLFLQIGGIHDR